MELDLAIWQATFRPIHRAEIFANFVQCVHCETVHHHAGTTCLNEFLVTNLLITETFKYDSQFSRDGLI
jgi:hypothetical protein